MDYLGQSIPKLGFGLMRLPMNGADVDMAQTKEMVDRFIAAGFTYFDTAYVYIGGKSEAAAKEALVDRYPRESFQLATKLPAWAAKTAEEAREMFYTSLNRTGAGYFDYYLLHSLSKENMHTFDRFRLWDYALELRDKGLVRHPGFSFHDTADVLDELLTKHPEMEFVQLQINYDDWESPTVQSRLCYEVALKHNKPIIIMEPVKGGLLASLPTRAADVLHTANPKASLASWALRYAASLDNIITVLSGMSDLAQLDDNMATMKDFQRLGNAEREAIARVGEALAQIQGIPCTGCRYCVKGCPQDISIPGILGAMNKKLVYENMESAIGSYGWETREGITASQCIECGQCETVCPQHISIMDELKRAAALFDKA